MKDPVSILQLLNVQYTELYPSPRSITIQVLTELASTMGFTGTTSSNSLGIDGRHEGGRRKGRRYEATEFKTMSERVNHTLGIELPWFRCLVVHLVITIDYIINTGFSHSATSWLSIYTMSSHYLDHVFTILISLSGSQTYIYNSRQPNNDLHF